MSSQPQSLRLQPLISWNSLLLIAIGLFCTLSVVSSRPFDAFASTTVIFAQVTCGLALLSFVDLPTQVGTLTVFGAAAATGSVVFTLIDQAAIVSIGQMPATAFWLLTGVSIIIVVKRFAFNLSMSADDLYVGTLCFLAMFLGLSQANPAAIIG